MQPMASSLLPSRCLKCMAMAKGFADRSISIDEVSSKKKFKADKKNKRRETISHELQQLQSAVVPNPAKAPLALGQKSNGSQAAPLQQPLSPEEVASQAKDLQEEVLRLQQDVRNSEFFRCLTNISRCMTPWHAHDTLCVSRFTAMCRNFNNVFLAVEEPVAEAASAEDSSTSGETSMLKGTHRYRHAAQAVSLLLFTADMHA